MSTLIWKELRENLKWAFLAMLVLGGAELYALYQVSDQRSYYDAGITLCRDSFLTVTTFGPAAIGFLVGLIQIVPELKRDRWAALLHRPLPRGRLLLGKAAAGVILYAVATVPPFLSCVWLAATPGHLPAPFVPGLTLAGIADTAAGLVYYFAALVVALERGGWVALRGLPALAAIHLSFFMVRPIAFSDAIGGAVLMSVALCAAACGAIYNRNSFGPRPWPGKLAMLAVAFYGVCGIGDLARSVISAGQTYDFQGAAYQLSDEDRPLKLNYVKGVIVSVQEMDGSTPTSPNFKPDRVQEHRRQLNFCAPYVGEPHGENRDESDTTYRYSGSYIALSSAYSYPQPEQWFHLVEQRSLIGISPRSKLPTSRLDQRGFQPPSATPVPFAPGTKQSRAGQDGYYLWTPYSLRRVNLARRQVIDLPLPLPGPLSGIINIYVRDATVPLTAMALATGMAIYNEMDGSLVTTLPYQHDVTRWGSLRIGSNAAADRFYLLYQPSSWIKFGKERSQMPFYIDIVDAHGELLQSYTLPPVPRIPPPRRWIDSLSRRLQSSAFFYGSMIYQKIGAIVTHRQLQPDISEYLGLDKDDPRETALYVTLLSFLCAGVTLFWARRVHYSWRRASAWAAFALAFNVAGLIVFRLVADWPHLVPCSACRRPRPVDRERCPHCADGWPPPTPNGAEIVEQVALNGTTI